MSFAIKFLPPVAITGIVGCATYHRWEKNFDFKNQPSAVGMSAWTGGVATGPYLVYKLTMHDVTHSNPGQSLKNNRIAALHQMIKHPIRTPFLMLSYGTLIGAGAFWAGMGAGLAYQLGKKHFHSKSSRS
jgi:hypothetical protein